MAWCGIQVQDSVTTYEALEVENDVEVSSVVFFHILGIGLWYVCICIFTIKKGHSRSNLIVVGRQFYSSGSKATLGTLDPLGREYLGIMDAHVKYQRFFSLLSHSSRALIF